MLSKPKPKPKLKLKPTNSNSNSPEVITLLIAYKLNSPKIYDWYILGRGQRKSFDKTLHWVPYQIDKNSLKTFLHLYQRYLLSVYERRYPDIDTLKLNLDSYILSEGW